VIRNIRNVYEGTSAISSTLLATNVLLAASSGVLLFQAMR